MTSNARSSALPKTNGAGPMTYEKLQVEPQRLHNLAWVLKGEAWEALEEFLQMERQVLLARLEDSNDPVEREASRVVAKWIKHFLGAARDWVLEHDSAEREPAEETEPDYMARDSDGDVPRGTEED